MRVFTFSQSVARIWVSVFIFGIRENHQSATTHTRRNELDRSIRFCSNLATQIIDRVAWFSYFCVADDRQNSEMRQEWGNCRFTQPGVPLRFIWTVSVDALGTSQSWNAFFVSNMRCGLNSRPQEKNIRLSSKYKGFDRKNIELWQHLNFGLITVFDPSELIIIICR